MSDFDSLREDVAGLGESFASYSNSVTRYIQANELELQRLWSDNAALRDEIHAVANRVEALTAFVVSDPAEVAAKIVTDTNRATLREVTDNGD